MSFAPVSNTSSALPARLDNSRLHRRLNSHTAMLHLLAINTGSMAAIVRTSADLVAALVVDVFDVEGMDVPGKVAAVL
jgi:hypothetical protein